MSKHEQDYRVVMKSLSHTDVLSVYNARDQTGGITGREKVKYLIDVCRCRNVGLLLAMGVGRFADGISLGVWPLQGNGKQ